jgi:hypothetical protein
MNAKKEKKMRQLVRRSVNKKTADFDERMIRTLATKLILKKPRFVPMFAWVPVCKRVVKFITK